MKQTQLQDVIKLFQSQKAIVLAYFFGSRSTNSFNKFSDYDFAILLKGLNKKKAYQIKFQLEDRISRILGTDKIDVLILNTIDQPELMYNVIYSGQLIHEVEPYRIIFEPQVLNKYFDFRNQLLKYNLTKA